jgi:murein tripeptide amidase MpaA
VEVLKTELTVALSVDWWREPSYTGKYVDAQFKPSQVSEAKELLANAGLDYEILIEDVQKQIDSSHSYGQRLKFSADNDVDFDYSVYHDLDEITAWMDTLQKTYPDLVELVQVGTSFEGRDITAVKFTGKSNSFAHLTNSTQASSKPGIWLDGGIHAREWVSPAVNVFMLGKLLADYGIDAETTDLLDSLEWFILPVFNVDGYQYTFDKDRMWRKTRSTYSSKLCVGVDPNRNWDWHWGEAGTSKNPCADDFQGPSAFSEIEVSSVAAFIKKQTNLNGYINFHSYSQLWMSPWGYTSDLPPTADYDAQRQVSKDAVAALAAVHGTSYDFGPISSTIYPASGSSADWTYGECGILYSYGVELRDTGKTGFLLPEDQILPSGEETLAAVKVMATAIKGSKKAEFTRLSADDCAEEDLCVFNSAGDSECCSAGEMCIAGVGCRC